MEPDHEFCPWFLLDDAGLVGAEAEVGGAPLEGFDDGCVVDGAGVGVDDGAWGAWGACGAVLKVELEERVYGVFCGGRGILDGLGHLLDEVGSYLLRDHPVVAFNGGFGKVAGAVSRKVNLSRAALTRHSGQRDRFRLQSRGRP